MTDQLECVSPVDGRVYVRRPLATGSDVVSAVRAAQAAQAQWREVPLADRQRLLSDAVDAFVADGAAIAEEITWQMGRPITQAPGEIRGFEERARHMIAIAPDALANVEPQPKAGFTRFVSREPLGLVFVIAPWNYPFLTAVNAVVPALMAGNAVLLKHSAQTPLASERFARIFTAAGLPEGLFHALHLDHDAALRLAADRRVDFVAFTGSVDGGHAVQRALAERFAGAGLELGGKDPAYVRADADLDHAVENVLDGVFFNSGQSCCGIERIYVHQAVYDAFVERAAALAAGHRLGDPTDAQITLGPMVRAGAADAVRDQIAEALAAGARTLVDESRFPASRPGTPYLAPQLLVNVHHGMRLMSEETFGPVAGIVKVSDDEQAIEGMNDSRYGLTASVWTRDEAAALAIGRRVETGTFFMNRCDYLDPALAWAGIKDSGRGCTLSRIGYEQLTRPKSYHLRNVW